jgi:hypothetical protein
MSDLISRKEVLKHIEKIRQGAQMMDDIRRASVVMNGMDLCEEAVRNQPSAQSERKKGKWIPQDHNKTNGMASTLVYYYPKCSVCGYCDNYTNFCPNCGADMREDGD